MATAEARMSRRARMMRSTVLRRQIFRHRNLSRPTRCDNRWMARARKSTQQQYARAVAAYVAAGGDESVQRVITAVSSLAKKLDQWYARQLADLDVSHGEWSVLANLALGQGEPVTPSKLAEATNVAASSMTHRLDRMA